jgi:cell wall-associated NlpC family hydrolase
MKIPDIKDLIGIPYCAHGRDKTGMDCYALAIEIFRRSGITLPDIYYSDTEIETNKRIMESLESTIPNIRLDKPELLCIIEFNVLGEPAHIGIYIGNNEFIHASRKAGVVIDKLWRWEKRVKGYYRVTA